jgi:hypothetical protein
MAAAGAGSQPVAGSPVTCHTKLKKLQTEEFTWSIEGLTLERLKAVPPGSVLAGPTLTLDGVEMYASLFCNGDGSVAETKDHACLVRGTAQGRRGGR